MGMIGYQTLIICLCHYLCLWLCLFHYHYLCLFLWKMMEEVSNLWRLWWIIGYQTGCGIWFCKNILATHKALKFKQSVRWILDNSHISRSQPKSFLETHFLFFSLPVLEDCDGDYRVSDIWFFGKYLSITLSTHNAFKSYNLISRWHWLWHLRHWLQFWQLRTCVLWTCCSVLWGWCKLY